MKVRPLRNRVIIQFTEPEKTTKSGFIIPDRATEKPESGTILAVGPGRITDAGILVPPVVQVGDTVVFPKGIGEKVKIDGQEYLVAIEDDLIGIVEQ